ncbi:MAG: glutamate-5-semialdehyde dehydrogenase [Muribaculaceae bacterium]|nr:glutamate-5-semialdehyde dehydrogenase [Muribaculaceae bacterium]
MEKEILEMIHEAKVASNVLLGIEPERIASVLVKISERLRRDCDRILEANALDLELMDQSNPDYDRLKLTSERVDGIAGDMFSVSRLEVPYGKVLSQETRPNGMTIKRVSVPFGVIGVIYEARPNVTSDVFALCFRAGSACVLKGGHDADRSSRAIVEIIHDVLREEGLPEALCMLLPASRESAACMMDAVGDIDVIIPRGGRGLIDYVRNNSRVPVIETGAGVCHTYIDRAADCDKAKQLVLNAKTRRVSVCNALDCVIVHADMLPLLAAVCEPLAMENVVIYADVYAFEALDGKYPASLLEHATADSFGTEYRDYKMAIKTVGSLEEALEHISRFGSHHSECIVSEDAEATAIFQSMVDASCVYANVSTAFTDGAQFGFGAEIGISTQKLHARGPMALPELTTYKYLITGTGQTRQP